MCRDGVTGLPYEHCYLCRFNGMCMSHASACDESGLAAAALRLRDTDLLACIEDVHRCISCVCMFARTSPAAEVESMPVIPRGRVGRDFGMGPLHGDPQRECLQQVCPACLDLQ